MAIGLTGYDFRYRGRGLPASRRSARCRVLGTQLTALKGHVALVQFEDGEMATVPRCCVRSMRSHCIDVLSTAA